jgi:4-amino-4-deoxy-L-arabinose transferase-like glycosyltransferase
MARGDGWLTPKFLGRYALYKPPMLYWLSGISAKIFGESRFALRLPSLIAGAATATIVYLWLGGWAGIAAAVLLISSHLFFVMSRVALTDALLTLEMTWAMWSLKRGSYRWFGAATGLAIMTKGVAGVLPFIALATYLIFVRERPPWRRCAEAVAIAAAIALPWHLYQLVVHTRWFWAEYVLTELWTFGTASPPQAVESNHAWFYAKRLFLMDPALVLLGIVGVARVRSAILAAWVAAVIVALFAFQYRNASYLEPMLPALALWGVTRLDARWVLAIGLAAFVDKAMLAEGARRLPFAPESVSASAAKLEQYAAMKRTTELFIVEPDDQFYSACLRLPRVRYVYIDPRSERRRYPLDFEHLGILIPVADFEKPHDIYRQRLKEWGLDSDSPIGTTILAGSTEEIERLIAAHPHSDFYWRGEFRLAK